jgi:hypothetical protein
MQANQTLINGMLNNIADPGIRKTYGDILRGRYAYNVFCINPQMNPKTEKPFHAKKCLVGHMTASGQVYDSQTVDKEREPIAGLLTSRDRLDGRKGFRCYCGNSSIQCAEELGVLKQSAAPMPPTKRELEEIFLKIQSSGKGPLQFVGGVAEYDGFRLEQVAAE